jgi:hypothetical protein
MENHYEIIALVVMAGFGFLYSCFKKGMADSIMKWFQQWFKEKFEGEVLDKEFSAVFERLVELKTELKADRVYVSQFHNGSVFTNQKPIWKMTRTYEICAQGVSYESQNMQNVMAISIWDSISGIFDNKLKKYCKKLEGLICGECKNYGVYTYRVEKMPESFAKVLLRNQGVGFYIQVPIIENGDHLVGFVGIEFLDKDITIDNPCFICQKVQEIAFFLNKD